MGSTLSKIKRLITGEKESKHRFPRGTEVVVITEGQDTFSFSNIKKGDTGIVVGHGRYEDLPLVYLYKHDETVFFYEYELQDK